jgi:hypothetical protein
VFCHVSDRRMTSSCAKRFMSLLVFRFPWVVVSCVFVLFVLCAWSVVLFAGLVSVVLFFVIVIVIVFVSLGGFRFMWLRFAVHSKSHP